MQRDPFYGVPVQSGSTFEGLIASLQPELFAAKITAPRPSEDFRWRSDIVVGPNVSVWRTRYSGDWSFSSEASEEDLFVGFLDSGATDLLIGAKTARRTPSTIALMPLPLLRRHNIRAIDGTYSSVMLRFRANVVRKVLTALFGRQTLSGIDLAPVLDLATPLGQTLRLLARTIVSGMHDAQLLRRSPAASALLTEAALSLIFSGVPHGLTHRLDVDPPDVAARQIQKAIDFMQEHLHLPLTMLDVAEAAGMSQRSLQTGFRKYRDSTPVAYLRSIRLQAAHAELSRPENELPISEVALKWGFVHLGRFAAQYHAAFGAYPSETVRRHRAL